MLRAKSPLGRMTSMLGRPSPAFLAATAAGGVVAFVVVKFALPALRGMVRGGAEGRLKVSRQRVQRRNAAPRPTRPAAALLACGMS